MAQECEKISKSDGEIEIDESYFETKRTRDLVLSCTLPVINKTHYLRKKSFENL